MRGFARRRPDVAVCVLRFANILGPTADTPLADYFALPVLPTVLGYDPRLQFVHEDDVIEVLRIAAARSRGAARSTAAPSTSPATGCCCCRSAPGGSGRPTVPLLLPARHLGRARCCGRWA